MCQLTLVDFSDNRLNSLYLTLQLVENSREHADGCGFWCEEKVYKQEIAPYLTTNLGTNIARIIKNSKAPVMGHVRKASLCYGKKSVAVENSHPFFGQRFILAHNGTLEPEDKKLFDALYPNSIDSEMFQLELEELARTNPEKSIIELLNEIYLKFTGKFAFLITDKKDGNIYVVRGETATLFKFKSQVKNLKDGTNLCDVTIINTERAKLQDTILLFSNILQANYRYALMFEQAFITEVGKNGIYLYKDRDLVHCGEIKERERKVFFPVATTTTRYVGGIAKSYGTINDQELYKVAESIKNFCYAFGVSIPYVDEMVYVNFGKRISEMEKDDILKIPKYLNLVESTLPFSKKRMTDYWKEIMGTVNGDEEFPHFYGLPFPYMLADRREIEEYLARQSKFGKIS